MHLKSFGIKGVSEDSSYPRDEKERDLLASFEILNRIQSVLKTHLGSLLVKAIRTLHTYLHPRPLQPRLQGL